MTKIESLADTLNQIRDTPLNEPRHLLVEKVRRRIVDDEKLTARLDVAAFQSAT
jgi:hypothetical protein